MFEYYLFLKKILSFQISIFFINVRVWRGTEDGEGHYTDVQPLQPTMTMTIPESTEECAMTITGTLSKAAENGQLPSVIPASGDSVTSTCYYFSDLTAVAGNTYYYVLEDINQQGERDFHCNDLATVPQSQIDDVDKAKAFCHQLSQ